MTKLKAEGIACAIHYPVALPFVEAYGYKEHLSDDFPMAVQVTARILSLPIYAEMGQEGINEVSSALNNSY